MAINFNDPWIDQTAQQQFGSNYGLGTDRMVQVETPDYSGEGLTMFKSMQADPNWDANKQNTLSSVLFGTDPKGAKELTEKLQQIGQEAGLPANFDWTPHLVAAAKQRQQQQGGNSLYNYLETPTAQVLSTVLASASQQAPQLAGLATRYQQGGDLWNQSVQEQQARAAKHKSNIGAVNATAYTGLAAMLGGAAMGAEAGAGGAAAEEAGLAAYTNIGAGGGATAGGAGMGIDWGNTLAQSGGTMTDVSPGLFESAGTGGGSLGLESSFMGPAGAEEAGLAAYTNIGGGGAASLGGYKFPYGDVIKGALGLYLQGQQAKDLKGIASNAANLSDPFAAERPRYQQQYRELTSAPSNFFKDPAIADVISNQQDITGRKLAASGYNMSGNFADEVARTGQREAFKQYIPFTEMIGRSAGAFQGTQGAGTAYAQPATAANTLDGGSVVGIGNVLESIFKGQQPNSAQQAQGVPKNQNVLQSIFL